jgi:hypothetical protein
MMEDFADLVQIDLLGGRQLAAGLVERLGTPNE